MIYMICSAITWIVQAVTECLPISSSGHVALYQWLSKKNGSKHDALLSEQAYMFAHIPALLASLMYTRHVWVPLFIACLHMDISVIQPMIFIVITTTLSVVGYLVQKKWPLTVPLWVGFVLSAIVALCIAGIKTGIDIYRWSYNEAMILGLVQACVVLPGLSRLGCVTFAGCLLGYSPVVAYALAWLVHIPLMFGGVCLGLIKSSPPLFKIPKAFCLLGYIFLILSCYLLLLGTAFLLQIDKYWYFACYLCIPIGIAWYKDRENV